MDRGYALSTCLTRLGIKLIKHEWIKGNNINSQVIICQTVTTKHRPTITVQIDRQSKGMWCEKCMIMKKQKPHLINSIEIEAQPPTNYYYSFGACGWTNERCNGCGYYGINWSWEIKGERIGRIRNSIRKKCGWLMHFYKYLNVPNDNETGVQTPNDRHRGGFGKDDRPTDNPRTDDLIPQ